MFASESDVDHLLRPSQNGTSRVCASRTNSKWTVLQESPDSPCEQIPSKTKRLLGRQNLDFAWWQCTCSHISQCETVLGLKRNHHFGSSTVFLGLSPLWFLPFSKTERYAEGDTLWRNRWHQGQRDSLPQMHQKRGICTVLQGVVKKNGKVRESQWRILWRGQLEITEELYVLIRVAMLWYVSK